MAYSIMLWLTNPGEQVREDQATEIINSDRSRFPGARGGVNVPPAATRLVYGVYDEQAQAEKALEKISHRLEKNEPLRLEQESGSVFLVPCARVHYAVMSEFVRPKDNKGQADQPAQSVLNELRG